MFNLSDNRLLLAALLVCSVAAVFWFLPFVIEKVSAQVFPMSEPIPMAGYIWSGYNNSNEGIGWISMHCSNTSSCAENGGVDYGVGLKKNGDIEGFAWSPNIGWVQFGNLNTSNMPNNQGNARVTEDGDLLGWARAIAGRESGAGWDGWILLSSSQWGIKFDFTTGETITTPSNVYSWAWGGDTVAGWLDFSLVVLGEIPDANDDVDLIVANLSYQAAGTPDRGNGRYGAMRFPMSLQNIGTDISPENEPIAWRVEIDDQRTGVIDHTRQSTEQGSLEPDESTSAQTSLNNFLYGVYKVTAEVNQNRTIDEADFNNNIREREFVISPPDPQMTIWAESEIIRSGDTATIEWNTTATYPMDCEVVGPGVDHTFDPSEDGTTGSLETTERINAAIYTVTCNEPVTDTTFVSNELRVEVIPEIREI